MWTSKVSWIHRANATHGAFHGSCLLLCIATHAATQTFEASTDWLASSDLWLSNTSLSYTVNESTSDWSVGTRHGSIQMDFESPDIFTRPTSVQEHRSGLTLDYQQPLGTTITGQLGLEAFHGFTSFSAAWLHEYYQQRYGAFGYEETEPYGGLLSAGLQWEYLAGSGFLNVAISRIQQRIAPGASFDGTLTLGNKQIESQTASVASENILSPRTRSRLGLTLINTTDRSVRHSLSGAINYAFAERWVLHGNSAWTKESPSFNAYLAEASLDYNPTPSIILSLSGRYYQDSGEIENSLLFSTAAPGNETFRLSVGFHYLGEKIQFKLWLAPYWNRYDPVGSRTQFFSQLYRDRDWIHLQSALTWEF